MNPKIFAAYLPQYHETEENNRFWGDGFTDWVSVKKAKPLFAGHMQPKVPLNRNYYDLSDCAEIVKQVHMARQYGIDGFNIYHYWFENGHKALYKPAEALLKNKDIDIEFFFTWDNSSWKRTWSNVVGNDWVVEEDNTKKDLSEYLLKMDYGKENDWKEHFEYLLPFFRDERYLKIDNKPVFMFFTNIEIETLKKMVAFWENLAKENGFEGIYVATQKGPFFAHKNFDAEFYYQPHHAGWAKENALKNRIRKLWFLNHKKKLRKYSYDSVYKKVIAESRHAMLGNILGAFVAYDDTPRRGNNGTILVGDSPEKFCKYFEEIYKIARARQDNLLLLTAWNEWGEGTFLEPDESHGYRYLESIRSVVGKYKLQSG